jgi:hypothetical protein
MAKTLASLRSECRMILDEVTEADWTDTQIDTEINYAYLEMYAAVVSVYEDYYRTLATTPLVADQQEYALPDDFYKVRRLEAKYTSEDIYHKVKSYSFDQIARGYDTDSYANTSRPIYELTGTLLRILPVPTADMAAGIRLVYIATAIPLASDTSAINIPFPDLYAKYISLGACAKLLKKGQQEEAVARGYNEEYQIGLEKMKNELEDRYADGVKMIQDTIQQNNVF